MFAQREVSSNETFLAAVAVLAIEIISILRVLSIICSENCDYI